MHAHAQRVEGAPRIGTTPWSSLAQLLARWDEAGVERGVIQPLLGPEFYEPQSNQDVLEMARAHPDRVTPFFCIHPRAVRNAPDADFRPLIEYYLEQGCRGFGEATFNLPFRDPLVRNLLAQLDEYDLPFCFHLHDRAGEGYGFIDDPGLPGLEEALRRYRRIRFLGHSPVFWSEIGRLQTPADRPGYPNYAFDEEGVLPTLLRRYPNLYGDLSAGSGHNALARNPEYAVRFLDEFQDRLLFGTDICAPQTPLPLVDLLNEMRADGRVSETAFQKIARENAQRLLGLSSSGER